MTLLNTKGINLKIIIKKPTTEMIYDIVYPIVRAIVLPKQ